MAMAEIIAKCSGRLKLDHMKYVLVNVDAGTSHNVCGPRKIGIFKKESIENAKLEERLIFCNIVVEVSGKNRIVLEHEFLVNNFEEETSLGYEAEYSDKDVRFIQSYIFDSLRLVPSTAKGKKVKVSAFARSTVKACMDVNIAFKSHVSRYLRKPIVILVRVVVILLAWLALLFVVNRRYLPLFSHTGISSVVWATKHGST